MCVSLCDCIHTYAWEIGARASYVAVVIVVVGVDASLIPVNGLLGLNRRGAFVWAGSIIHLLHSCPWGSGGGVAYNTGTALTLNTCLSVLYLPLLALSLSLFLFFCLSSFSSWTFPPLGTNAETVITQSLAIIPRFHVPLDSMFDELMCSSGPRASLHYHDGRPQTEPLGSSTSWHKHRGTNFFFFSGWRI